MYTQKLMKCTHTHTPHKDTHASQVSFPGHQILKLKLALRESEGMEEVKGDGAEWEDEWQLLTSKTLLV